MSSDDGVREEVVVVVGCGGDAGGVEVFQSKPPMCISASWELAQRLCGAEDKLRRDCADGTLLCFHCVIQ